MEWDESMSRSDILQRVWPNLPSKYLKKADFYHNLDIQCRGAFLIQTNWVESDIDGILALIFCGKDKGDLNLIRSTVLKRLGFDAKISSLNKIIKLRYSDFGNKHENLKQLFDDLVKNLETIKKFRNKLAHSSLSITADFLEKDPKDRIQICLFDDGEEKYLEIMKKEVDDNLVIITHVQIVLQALVKYIQSDVPINDS